MYVDVKVRKISMWMC